MNPFTAEQTPKTPHISFDPVTGVFELSGKSVPENSVIYYKPLFEWVDSYIQNPAKTTTLIVQFDYFNTSSAKCIIDLFKRIELISKNQKGEAIINWKYDEADEDMQEAGEDYKSIIKIPFNLISFQK
ncbi:MAG: DUF1987 domain-containing protein [Bacteroidetes bacterium]|nr:MAG: DUF1987 domain-containing protein [Bacteroidota bacterium]